MSLKKIDDVERPQIGKYYLVPCIWDRWLGASERWIPVIGDWHNDPEIGAAFYHFHFDLRFFSVNMMTVESQAETLMARVQRSPVPFETGSEEERRGAPSINFRNKRMMREMPDFPACSPQSKPGGKANLLRKLEYLYRDVVLKDCLTCPHRGMNLKNLPRKEDGTVICNGHGLKWNLQTRRMVER
jgi:hypothetical protein